MANVNAIRAARQGLTGLLSDAGIGNAAVRDALVDAWIELAVVRFANQAFEDRRLRQIDRKQRLSRGEISRAQFDAEEAADPYPDRMTFDSHGASKVVEAPALGVVNAAR